MRRDVVGQRAGKPTPNISQGHAAQGSGTMATFQPIKAREARPWEVTQGSADGEDRRMMSRSFARCWHSKFKSLRRLGYAFSQTTDGSHKENEPRNVHFSLAFSRTSREVISSRNACPRDTPCGMPGRPAIQTVLHRLPFHLPWGLEWGRTRSRCQGPGLEHAG